MTGKPESLAAPYRHVQLSRRAVAGRTRGVSQQIVSVARIAAVVAPRGFRSWRRVRRARGYRDRQSRTLGTRVEEVGGGRLRSSQLPAERARNRAAGKSA